MGGQAERGFHARRTAGSLSESSVRYALEALASTEALQTAVLEAIADRLDELCLLSGEPASPDRSISSTLRELEGHLEALDWPLGQSGPTWRTS